MDDLVALVVGVAQYNVPDWNIRDDRTAEDAVAVAAALRRRGVPIKKIKLFVSHASRLRHRVDVPAERLTSAALETFITQELGQPPFDGRRFLLFWSGHGVGTDEPLVIVADSFKTATAKRRFYCLGINGLCAQLQGMPAFQEQLFCTNACQIPAEWSITPQDDKHAIEPLEYPRSLAIRQARFSAVRALEAAPVQDRPDKLSNGFAQAVCDCIDKGSWPPRDIEWHFILKAAWPAFDPDGPYQREIEAFSRLWSHVDAIDREAQQSLVYGAFKQALEWKERHPLGVSGTDADAVWRRTVIDLHARNTDLLDRLMERLRNKVFDPKYVPHHFDPIKWPDRGLQFESRKQKLLRDLNYYLDGILTDAVPPEQCTTVVYVQIKGPCTPADEPLIREMLAVWEKAIRAVLKLGNLGPCLPLLLVGHDDPEPATQGAASSPDMTSLYHGAVLNPDDEHRLNLIQGGHLQTWLNKATQEDRWMKGVMEVDGAFGRSLEAALAMGLGKSVIQEIEHRLGAVREFVYRQAFGNAEN
jgi:hypothetical protein